MKLRLLLTLCVLMLVASDCFACCFFHRLRARHRPTVAPVAHAAPVLAPTCPGGVCPRR